MYKIEKLTEKRKIAFAGGGDTSVQMQHNLNKLTARERIALLLDEGSFVELGTMVNGNGAGVITGYGTVNHRLVYIYSEDFTVDGGLIGNKTIKKIIDVMEMAQKMGAPLIQFIDSTGVKVEEGMETLVGYGKIISMNARLSGVVPQIAVIAGPCTGLSSISAAMSDITIICENSGEMYINPPDYIEENNREFVESKMYASSESSSKNGSVQLTSADDKEAIELVKKLLDFLPSNNIEIVPINYHGGSGVYLNNELNNLINDENINIRELINKIVDNSITIEFDGKLSEAVITMLAKINGVVVGIIANNKNMDDGRLNIRACEKVTKFTKLCDSFNISIVTLVNTKGFVLSKDEENRGLALSIGKMIYALSEANVPKVSVIIGEVYGSAYVSFASKETAFDVTYAWPHSNISIIEPKNAVKLLNREEIIASENPKVKEEEMLQKYIEENASAFKAAEEGYIDDVITPSETAVKLFMTLDMLQSKRLIKYPKKHGSMLI